MRWGQAVGQAMDWVFGNQTEREFLGQAGIHNPSTQDVEAGGL